MTYAVLNQLLAYFSYTICEAQHYFEMQDITVLTV